jgi:hypothetical protein
MAIEYGLNNNIPYIGGLKKGGRVWGRDKVILEQHYGLDFSELIT